MKGSSIAQYEQEESLQTHKHTSCSFELLIVGLRQKNGGTDYVNFSFSFLFFLQDICKKLHQALDKIDEERYDAEAKVGKTNKEVETLSVIDAVV